MTIRRPPNEIATEIKMLRSARHGAVVIVEGRKDFLFYKRFINNSECQLFPTGNKSYAIEVITRLEQDSITGVLAIVDADYDRILDIPLASPNIVLTDTHDIESLIIHSSAFDNFIEEFASGEKIRKLNTDLRSSLYACCAPLGCLRLLSLKNNLNLKFEGVSIKKSLKSDSFELDPASLVRNVKNHSSLHALNEQLILQQLYRELKMNYADFDICCGHDLVEILSLGLQSVFGSHKHYQVEPEFLEKTLRLAYSFDTFKTTEIYQRLLEWEQNNAPYLLFAA